jgi:hypothetical protein
MPSASPFETAVLSSLSDLKEAVTDIQHTIHGNGSEGLKTAVVRLLADKAERDKVRDRAEDGRTWFRRAVAGPVIGKVVLALVAMATVYAVKEIRGTRNEVQEIKQAQTFQTTK